MIAALEVAGERPYERLSLIKLTQARPPVELTHTRDWSDDFKNFVQLCLQNDPSKRPSAEELLKHKVFEQLNQEGDDPLAIVRDLLADDDNNGDKSPRSQSPSPSDSGSESENENDETQEPPPPSAASARNVGGRPLIEIRETKSNSSSESLGMSMSTSSTSTLLLSAPSSVLVRSQGAINVSRRGCTSPPIEAWMRETHDSVRLAVRALAESHVDVTIGEGDRLLVVSVKPAALGDDVLVALGLAKNGSGGGGGGGVVIDDEERTFLQGSGVVTPADRYEESFTIAEGTIDPSRKPERQQIGAVMLWTWFKKR